MIKAVILLRFVFFKHYSKNMKAEKGPRTFLVTLPTAQDVGDSSEGDAVQVDTISDVSEMSAGEL